MKMEDGKIVFRWQFLVIYILVAALISYTLIDYKIKKESPSEKVSMSTKNQVKVTSDEGFGTIDDIDVDDDSELEPMETLSEAPSVDESSTIEPTTLVDESTATTSKPTNPIKPSKPTEPTKPSSTTTTKPETTKAPDTTVKPPETQGSTAAPEAKTTDGV